MNTTFQLDAASDDDSIEAKREIVRQSLDEIAVEITKELRDADLNYPVYLFVPGSRHAVVSMMTPLDPSDEDWCRIGDIVREIVLEYLDLMRLQSVELPFTKVCG
jgi:hypothetical protein